MAVDVRITYFEDLADTMAVIAPKEELVVQPFPRMSPQFRVCGGAVPRRMIRWLSDGLEIGSRHQRVAQRIATAGLPP